MITSMKTELVSAVTDLLLAITVFMYSKYITTEETKKQIRANIWRYLFILVACGALLGSFAHGFILPEVFNQIVWWLIYLILDVSITLFALAFIYDCVASIKAIPTLLVLALICYIPLIVYDSFTIFIIYQLLVMMAALFAYGFLAIKRRLTGASWLCCGITVMIIGAILQGPPELKISLIWTFDNNSIYHVLSMIGMTLLFYGLRLDLKVR